MIWIRPRILPFSSAARNIRVRIAGSRAGISVRYFFSSLRSGGTHVFAFLYNSYGNSINLLSCSGPVTSVIRISISLLLRSEEHTSELQSRGHLVCRLLLEKKTHGYNLTG